MKGKTLALALVAILVAGVAYLVTNTLMAKSAPTTVHHEEHDHDHEAESPALNGIKLEPVLAGESWDVITATGKVGPNINSVVKIGPRIEGKVKSVKVSVGDVVSKGQVLATLSSMELAQARAAYKQASAKLRAAEQAYKSQLALSELGAFTKRPVEEARVESVAASGELAQARSELAQNQSELVRAESELAQCKARLERAKELYQDQIVSKQDLESAEAEFKRDSAEVELVKSKIIQTKAKIGQLENQVEIAAKYLEREEKVQQSNLLATKELQAAKAQVTEAKLELEAAEDTIRVLGASPSGSGDTIVVQSPISGRVVERNVSLGEMVDPSSVIFTIMDLSDVWVEADVYEKDLARIRKGLTAEIRIQSYLDKVFTGRVTNISDVLDNNSRTAKVRCSVSNPDGILKPEMFATINIILDKRDGAVLIPKHAVLDDTGKKTVFIACNDCPEDMAAGKSVCGEYDKREIKLGPAHGDKVEVLDGLAPGDMVVTEGHFQLKSALGSGKLEAGCGHDH